MFYELFYLCEGKQQTLSATVKEYVQFHIW